MNVGIVGAGIAGLSAAWFLRKRGIDSVIYEAGDRIGGVISSRRENGFLIEEGPQSMVAPPLLTEIDLAAIEPSVKKRFILRDGKLVSPSAALSLQGKVRMAAGIFLQPDADTAGDYARKRFGREAADYLFDPLLSGIYAGDPEKLSVRVIPRMRRGRRIVSFPKGLSQFAHALAEGMTIEFGTRRDWSLGEHHAIIYTPPPINIPYESVNVISLGFERDAVGHSLDGFGFLVPRIERRKILGCVFSSSLFSGRAPEGCTLLTVFSKGEDWNDLREILEIRSAPLFTHITRHEKAIPQYVVGYEKYLDEIRLLEEKNPGVYFAGSYLRGVSIGDTIESAREAVCRIT